jgi:hypothetical protein
MKTYLATIVEYLASRLLVRAVHRAIERVDEFDHGHRRLPTAYELPMLPQLEHYTD